MCPPTRHQKPAKEIQNRTFKVYGLPRYSKMELEYALQFLGMSLERRGLHLEGENGLFNAFVKCPADRNVEKVKKELCVALGAKHVKLLASYKEPRDSVKGNVLLLVVVPYSEQTGAAEMVRTMAGIENFAADHILAETGLKVKSVQLYSNTGSMFKYGMEMHTAGEANTVLTSNVLDAVWYNDTLMYALQKTKKQMNYTKYSKTESSETEAVPEVPEMSEMSEEIQLCMTQYV